MTQKYQTALITGAGSGLGRMLARQLATEGTTVAALDRNGEALQTLQAELAGKPFASAIADVRRADEVRLAVTEMEQKLGPFDLLIASAGVGMETSAFSFSAEDMETLITVNLIGVSHSIAAVLPGMIERNHGHIVALSSLASYRGMPLMAGYCSSKAGVNALMESLRAELRATKLVFTTICPGWVRTPMTENLSLPVTDMLEVEEAARLILAALYHRRNYAAFPARLVRRMRILRWLPHSVSDWLIARELARLKKERKPEA